MTTTTLTLDSSAIGKPSTSQIDKTNLVQAQEQDRVIGSVRYYLKSGLRPTAQETNAEFPATRQLLHKWRKLEIGLDNILRRVSGIHKQILLRLVYNELRKEMGHLGSDRVGGMARQRFYWPYMKADIEFFIGDVCQCLKQRAPVTKTRSPLQPIMTTSPFELVSIDFVHLEKSCGGNEYVLVIVDHFTIYVQEKNLKQINQDSS